jgi:ABC-type uncharacterized transport system substrate-binding protein
VRIYNCSAIAQTVALCITLFISFCAEAQQPNKIARIGFLGNTSANDSLKPFRGRLHELGYTEGQNIVIEPRYYEGKIDRLPDLAIGNEAAQAGKNATKEIPIIISNTSGRSSEALLVDAGGFFAANQNRLIDLALKHRLPASYSNARYVQAGGLMTYGPDRLAQYRRAADYADKILKGAKPANLPVERPQKFELVINLKTAKQIGLTIPPNVLARADQVIR